MSGARRRRGKARARSGAAGPPRASAAESPASSGGAARGDRLRWAVAAALLVAATLVVYGPALSGEYIWDDRRFIAENEMVNDPAGLRDIWLSPSRYEMQYQPLTYSTFWIDRALWGDDTRPSHVVNVLMHAVNALLLALVLSRAGVPGAPMAGLLFALHPVHVESVAWIAERKNTLSLLFMLLAAWAWLRSVAGEGPRSVVRCARALALAAFVAGLLSKSIVALLPVALAAWVWWRGERVRERLASLWPMVALGLAMAYVTSRFEARNTHGFDYGLSVVDSFLVAGRALWFYAAKLAWPAELLAIYPRWSPDPTVAWQWVPPLAWGSLLVAAWRFRSAIGRGPFAGLAFFTVAHAPTLGFADFGFLGHSFVADHFQYVPSVAFLALACGAGARTLARLDEAPRRAALAVVLVVAACLAGKTWSQSHVWQTRETFWAYNLERNPTHTAAGALGDVYLRRDELDRALPLLRQSLELRENERGRYRLGELLSRRGELDAAAVEFERAVEVNARKNRDRAIETGALFNLGTVHWKRRDWASAADAWRRTLAADPNHELAREWLAKAEARLGADG